MDLNESFSSFNPEGDYQYYKENAPPGFHFDDTDDMMLSYLLSKEQGHPLANILFKQVPLYDYNPNELQSQFNNGKGDELYLYTETKPLNNGWRVERKAGNGRWKTMIGEKKITRGGKTIGYKTTLSFFCGKEGKEKKTCWNMHEYKLQRQNGKRKRIFNSRVLKSIRGCKMKMPQEREDLVLCKIYKRRSFEKSCEAHNEEFTSISSITNNEMDASIDLINSLQSPTFVSNDLEQILSDVGPAKCLQNNSQLPESLDFSELQRFLMEDVN